MTVAKKEKKKNIASAYVECRRSRGILKQKNGKIDAVFVVFFLLLSSLGDNRGSIIVSCISDDESSPTYIICERKEKFFLLVCMLGIFYFVL